MQREQKITLGKMRSSGGASTTLEKMRSARNPKGPHWRDPSLENLFEMKKRDAGPYAPGNVRIVAAIENLMEADWNRRSKEAETEAWEASCAEMAAKARAARVREDNVKQRSVWRSLTTGELSVEAREP
jgi:hypothetical protein